MARNKNKKTSRNKEVNEALKNVQKALFRVQYVRIEYGYNPELTYADWDTAHQILADKQVALLNILREVKL